MNLYRFSSYESQPLCDISDMSTKKKNKKNLKNDIPFFSIYYRFASKWVAKR